MTAGVVVVGIMILGYLGFKVLGRTGEAVFSALKIQNLLDVMIQQDYQKYAEMAKIGAVEMELMTEKVALANEFVKREKEVGSVLLTSLLAQIRALEASFTTPALAVDLSKYYVKGKLMEPLDPQAVLDYITTQGPPEEFFAPGTNVEQQLNVLELFTTMQKAVFEMPLAIEKIQQLTVQNKPSQAAIMEVQQEFFDKFNQLPKPLATIIPLSEGLRQVQQQRVTSLLQAMKDLILARFEVERGAYSPEAMPRLYLLADLHNDYIQDAFAFLKAFLLSEFERAELANHWQQSIEESTKFIIRHN